MAGQAVERLCKDGDGSSPCAVIDPLGTNFHRVIGQWGDNGISATDGEKLRLVYGKRAIKCFWFTSAAGIILACYLCG